MIASNTAAVGYISCTCVIIGVIFPVYNYFRCIIIFVGGVVYEIFQHVFLYYRIFIARKNFQIYGKTFYYAETLIFTPPFVINMWPLVGFFLYFDIIILMGVQRVSVMY